MKARNTPTNIHDAKNLPTEEPVSPSHRIFFLDHLRAFVIVLIVVLHGSMTYMAYAPPWWYVIGPQNSLFFTMLVLLIDIPIMLIMFFVAGYFALPSLVKRGSAKFLKEKFTRIGAPWLVGVLHLASPPVYMVYYSRGIPMVIVLGISLSWAVSALVLIRAPVLRRAFA